MDVLLTLLLSSVTRTASLLAESRHVIGIAAALCAALLAAHLGWHGTDRLLSWRERPDED
ncbi:hypothetical protein GCM10010191_81390 [Actinomadura vinacea]|uniref:Uncharacterized protein n=1 Tax=Actinomadura vinacea TaxID=115336 RepID=A0ABN3KAB7_9ACTN